MKYLGGIEAAQDIVSKDYVDTGLDVKSNVAELAGIEESMIATSTYAVDDFLQYMDPNGYNHFAVVIAPIDIGDRLEVHENIEDTTISEQLRYLDGKMVTLTKAEYDALSYTEKMDPDKFYFITDVTVSSDDFIDDSVVALDSTWSSTKINLNVEQLQASLLTKQPMLTFDNTPTDSSDNPVKSQGIKTAIATAKDESISASEQELRDTVGWTGKNLVPIKIDYVKSYNTQSGTSWSGNTLTRNGMSFVFAVDDNEYVTSITYSGTPTSDDFQVRLFDDLPMGIGSYILTGASTSTVRLRLSNGRTGSDVVIGHQGENPATFTLENSDNSLRLALRIQATSAVSGTIQPMIRLASISDDTYEPYHEDVAGFVDTKAEQWLNGAVGWTGKQLIPFPYYENSLSRDGVDFTVNSDGSVTLQTDSNGATDNTVLFLMYNTTLLNDKAVHCLLSTSKTEFITETDVNMVYSVRNADSSQKQYTRDNDFEITKADSPHTADGEYLRLMIRVTSGKVITTPITVYPLVCLPSVTDILYEPYHESVDKAKFNRSEQNLLGAKNLVPTDVLTIKSNNSGTGWVWNGNAATYNGISFTINDDGTILVQGSIADPNDGNAVLNLYLPTSLGGNFYYYGCPANGSVTSYDCFAYDNTEQERAKKWDGVTSIDLDFGEYESQQVQFIAGHINRLAIRVHVECADTLNILFKPMLRMASDPDDTYQPYAMTNRQLTEAILHTSVTVNPEIPPTEDGAIWIST